MASRGLLVLCGSAVIGGLVAASPALIDRAGMIQRDLYRRTDGVGQAPSFALARGDGRRKASSATLGEHVLLWHEDGAGPPLAVTPAIDTQVSGSSLIAFTAGYTSNDQGPTDNKGNTWTLLGAPVIYRGYGGQFNVKAYAVFSAQGGSGHTLSIIKNGVPSGEITVPFVEIRQSPELHAVAQNYPTAAPVVMSDSVTTTGPATLVAFWWGDTTGLEHSALPDNGFTIIENFVSLPPNSAVQCVVAARQVSAAGTYNVSWTQSPSQGAVLWLFAFQSGDTVFENGFE